jgi:hypothetical protein
MHYNNTVRYQDYIAWEKDELMSVEYCRNDTNKAKPTYSDKKSVPLTLLTTINSTRTGSGSNPGLQEARKATNCLSHDRPLLRNV